MVVRRGLGVAAVLAATLLLTSCIEFDDGGTIVASPTASARATGVAYADVTGAGAAEPIVVTDDGRLVRASSCGADCWQVRETVALDGPASSVAAADLDGDEVDDVVVSTTAGTRAYFGGAASGSRPSGLVATDSRLLDATTVSGTVLTGDLDGDGDTDVAVRGLNSDPSWSTPQLVEVRGDGAGGFAAPVLRAEWVSPGSIVSNVALADIDGNGDREVLVAEGHAIIGTAFLVAYGDDPVDDALNVEVSFVRDLAAGDLDGDGRDEVVARSPSLRPDFPAVISVRCSTGTTYVSCGSGPGFGVLQTGSFGSGPMAVADLDGDGHADLVAVDREDGRLSTWRGLGDARFAQYRTGARIDHPIGAGPRALALEPGTGLPDLLVAVSVAGAGVQVLDNISTVP
jgi:hypothetical protein